MLKKCYGLVLGLVVLAGSACVTPTHASSASVIITNVQAGSQASAQEERIALYNNASFEADITNWCVVNKVSVQFACFVPKTSTERIMLPGYSYAFIASEKAAETHPQANYSIIYASSVGGGGTIIASSDTISLLDKEGHYVNQVTWESSIASTQQLSRTKIGTLPDFYLNMNSANDWQKKTYSVFPDSQVVYRDMFEEPELPEVPVDPVDPDPVHILPAIITELLPNPAGSDTGEEFIELYNPNLNDAVILEDYRLSVGPSFEKTYILTIYTLEPGEYKTYSNAELNFTLLNSSSKAKLVTDQAVVANEVPAYTAPPEGESWALIDGIWQYTDSPTPGAENRAHSRSEDKEGAETGASSTSSSPKPCAANQYRSSETNRCRLISSASVSTLPACKEGQVRNPETKRCKAVVASTTPAACKEGQERNLETGRCRTVKKLSPAGFGIKGATTQNQSGLGWYMWAAIAGIVLLISGYAVWEWREELRKALERIKAKFAGGSN
jgi:hypothetical protein